MLSGVRGWATKYSSTVALASPKLASASGSTCQPLSFGAAVCSALRRSGPSSLLSTAMGGSKEVSRPRALTRAACAVVGYTTSFTCQDGRVPSMPTEP